MKEGDCVQEEVDYVVVKQVFMANPKDCDAEVGKVLVYEEDNTAEVGQTGSQECEMDMAVCSTGLLVGSSDLLL